MTDIELEFCTLCTVFNDAGGDSKEKFIETVRSLSVPVIFTGRDVYIPEQDYDDFEVVYSTSEPEPPEQEVSTTVFLADILNDSTLHTHSYIESENLDNILRFHEQSMSPCEEIDLNYISSIFSTDESIEDLVESEFVPDTDLSGVQFESGDHRFIFTEQDDNTLITVTDPGTDSVEPDNIVSEVKNRIDGSRDLAEEIIQ